MECGKGKSERNEEVTRSLVKMQKEEEKNFFPLMLQHEKNTENVFLRFRSVTIVISFGLLLRVF